MLIRRDDFCFIVARAINGVAGDGFVQAQQLAHIGFQPIKKVRIANQAIFNHLGDARRKFALRQSFERVDIRQHHFWLIKRANHVFAERVIDAGFAANAGIDLRE